MGIPLAALASQPQPTPFQQTGQLLGIQGAQQEQQLRQQQIQGATLQNQLQEQQLKDSQIFADSMRSNKGNLDAALEDAAQKGMSGQGYLQHGQQILQMKVAQQKLSSEQLDLQNKVFDKIDGQLQSYKALSPQDQQAQWPQYRQQVASIAPQLANTLPQNAPTSQQIDAFEPQLMGGKWATAREQKNRELAAQESEAATKAEQAKISGQRLQAELPGGPLNRVQQDIAVATNPQIQKGKVDVAREEGIARAQATAGSPASDPAVDMVGQGRMDYATATARYSPIARQAFDKELAAKYPQYNQMNYGVEKKVQQEFTSGDAAKSLTAFNTAIQHAQQAQVAADALNNGDIRTLNQIGNALGVEMGSDKVTNFNAIKSALTGEVSKVFKGGQATDAEIKEVQGPLNAANSPAQLKGALNTVIHLMNSKRDALKAQYEAGKTGQPNFGEMIYARDPQGKLHSAKPGTALPAGWTQEKAPQ